MANLQGQASACQREFPALIYGTPYSMKRSFPAAGGMSLLLALTAAAATEVRNEVPDAVSEFGAAAIRNAAAGLSLGRVVISVAGDLKPEAFRIRAGGGGYAVTGGDARGAMYGALDFAEQLERICLPG